MIKPISFGATLRQNVQIKKYFSKIPAGIVEIDFDSEEDQNAVKNAVNNWFLDTYGGVIYNKMSYGYTPKAEAEDWRIYALTTQKDGFERLESSKILGLELTGKEDDVLYVNYLQVKPATNHSNIFRKYRQVGKSLIEYLKTMYDKIRLDADKSAVGFYEKLGFSAVESKSGGKIMEWTIDGQDSPTVNDVKNKF